MVKKESFTAKEDKRAEALRKNIKRRKEKVRELKQLNQKTDTKNE